MLISALRSSVRTAPIESAIMSENQQFPVPGDRRLNSARSTLSSQLTFMRKLLCVYCASSDRLDPKYYAAAAELGTELVRRGWGLVYGGGKTGMMGAIARAV
jgi:hypothetical protein